MPSETSSRQVANRQTVPLDADLEERLRQIESALVKTVAIQDQNGRAVNVRINTSLGTLEYYFNGQWRQQKG